MEAYTAKSEIAQPLRKCILHFLSAIDGAIVNRFNKQGEVVDTIKVNYVYGPKEGIFHDLVDKNAHLKLPIVGVTMASFARDNDRIKDKLMGRYKNLNVVGEISKIPAPIPVNIVFNLDIMCKYQADIEQILSNFIPYSDPYFIVAMREPHTNSELRCEVLWNGDVSLEYPDERSGTVQYYRVGAKTSFTFKGYMFKDEVETIPTICKIDSNFILTNDFYCAYDELVENTEDNFDTETLIIQGAPRIVEANVNSINTGTFWYDCSGLNPQIKLNTKSIAIHGWFPNIDAVFLSASNPSMFLYDTPTTYNPFGSDSELYPPFNGVIVDFAKISNINVMEVPTFSTRTRIPVLDHTLTFNLPALTGTGYVDVIVLNNCGYSILSRDRYIKPDCCENPYFVTHPLYDVWLNKQDPFQHGIQVIGFFLE